MSDNSPSGTIPTDMNERIRALYKPKWIGYPRAITIRSRMESLLDFPKTHRMPNLAIIGESNSGKSMLVNNFFKHHGPNLDPNAEKTELPVLLIQTPAEPNESRLYRMILETLFADAERREPAESMIRRIKVILQSLETKMLIMDEFNNALAGSHLKQRRFLNGLRFLGNELKIPLVIAGTVEAQRALGSDPQLANRFEPVFLHRWELNEDFLRLMMTFEPTLGLKQPSDLCDKDIASRVLLAGEGLLGDILMLLRRLAEKAIREGNERIEAEWLTKPFLDEFGWVNPSLRTRSAG